MPKLSQRQNPIIEFSKDTNKVSFYIKHKKGKYVLGKCKF